MLPAAVALAPALATPAELLHDMQNVRWRSGHHSSTGERLHHGKQTKSRVSSAARAQYLHHQGLYPLCW